MRQQRYVWAWGLLLLQGFCAAFFLGDAVMDVFGIEQAAGLGESEALEYVVTAALVLGVAFTAWELRRMIARDRRISTQLEVASGAFADLLEQYFETWGLTTAEREVALMAIKGYSMAEMAELRDTREGTVKAQCSAVYRKAGVSGRLQLLSLFIDDLIAEDLVPKA